MLQFVRTILEKKIKMYVHSQLQIALWLFVLDHINYSRWLTAHISDMINLSTTHPELYRQFLNGNFVVQKNHKVLSEIALDKQVKLQQAHKGRWWCYWADGQATGTREMDGCRTGNLTYGT